VLLAHERIEIVDYAGSLDQQVWEVGGFSLLVRGSFSSLDCYGEHGGLVECEFHCKCGLVWECS